jgi:uncharacterized membrane protein
VFRPGRVGLSRSGASFPKEELSMSDTGGRSSLNLPENVVAMLAYLFGWVSGLIIFLIERQSSFVRFHALQSLIFFGVLTLVISIFARIPFVGWLIAAVGGITSFVFWIMGMVRAYAGELYRFPIAGDIAASQIKHE